MERYRPVDDAVLTADVDSVGDVGLFETFLFHPLSGLFRFAYIAYTHYTLRER